MRSDTRETSSTEPRNVPTLTKTDSPQPTAVGRSTASGKVILFGEHAVVYGHPAIAFPLTQIGLTATATPTDGPLWLTVDIYDGPLSEAPPKLAPLRTAVTTTLDLIGAPHEGLRVSCLGDFPLERGLGSSAAGAGSIISAILDLHGVEKADRVRHDLVQAAERVAHGNPSGLDASTVISHGPIWFQNGKAEPIEVHLGAPIVVADSGQPGDTHSAVDAVTSMLGQHPEDVEKHFSLIHDHTVAAREDLKHDNREVLGQRMDEVQASLHALSVSSPQLDHLVNAARAAGALGAKLTGGGRGGCIIALARDPEHEQKLAAALESAGALQTWIMDLQEGKK